MLPGLGIFGPGAGICQGDKYGHGGSFAVDGVENRQKPTTGGLRELSNVATETAAGACRGLFVAKGELAERAVSSGGESGTAYLRPVMRRRQARRTRKGGSRPDIGSRFGSG